MFYLLNEKLVFQKYFHSYVYDLFKACNEQFMHSAKKRKLFIESQLGIHQIINKNTGERYKTSEMLLINLLYPEKNILSVK